MKNRNRDIGRPSTSLYFIALIPDLFFRDEVIRIKESFKNRFGSEHALRSPAHITLHMPFKWRDDRFEILQKALLDFAAARKDFTLNLKNFGSFPRKVIFIRVEENEDLQKLHQSLVRMARETLKLENSQYKDKGFHPHMTVAFRDLRPSMYQLAWEEFGKKELSHSFDVSSVALLKHNGKSWDIYKEFSFNPNS